MWGYKMKTKYECGDCGCYFWVDDRNNLQTQYIYCPNCKEIQK